MGLEEPVVPEWRVGRLAISYVEDRDVILLEVEELIPGQDEDDDEEEDDDLEGGETESGAAVPEETGTLEGLESFHSPGELEGFDAEPGEPTEAGTVRFWATRDQMLALARHGAEVASRGRPTCRFCDQPMDPEGHVCPAMNGHRTADDE
jgi:hypothetical protein